MIHYQSSCLRGFCHSLKTSLPLALTAYFFSLSADASNSGPVVPEEYESTGGHSLAFGGSVATAIGGVSAIRCNPALLAIEKEYSVNGSYNWPTAGRDFYQLGVVDGKTSPIAAGFSYTGVMDNYQGVFSGSTSAGQSGEQVQPMSKDSPVLKRANLALAMPVGRMYFGAGASYVEANSPDQIGQDSSASKIKGFTMGMGAVAHLSPAFRVGVSAENLANKKVSYVAPTFYRGGASYFLGDVASFHLDYRSRDAVTIYEGSAPEFSIEGQGNKGESVKSESLINASTSIKMYDLLRLVVSSGRSTSESGASTRIAGGLSLINQKFNFSYQILKLDVKDDAIHHAMALGFDVTL